MHFPSFLFIILLFLLLLSLLIISPPNLHLFRYYRIANSSPHQLRSSDQLYGKRPRVSTPHRVIISMTTTPFRIQHLHYSLLSLLDQSRRVDQINLCIPYHMKRSGLPYNIPEHLESLENIKIIRCQDSGPITKLLPSLSAEHNNPDTKIIYLDDDRIYGYTTVEDLVAASEKYPNFAICNWGWKIPSDRNFVTHDRFPHIAFEYLFDSGFVDIIEGCEGCLVKPKFFNQSLYESHKAPPEVFFVDDIWISGNLALNLIPRYRIPLKLSARGLPKFPRPSQDKPLHSLNYNGHNNNIAIKYFENYW